MGLFWRKYHEARDSGSYWAAYAFITPVTGLGDLVVRLAYLLISGKVLHLAWPDWTEFAATFLMRTLFDGLWLALIMYLCWRGRLKAGERPDSAGE